MVYTLDMVVEVLQSEPSKPLSSDEIWERGVQRGLPDKDEQGNSLRGSFNAALAHGTRGLDKAKLVSFATDPQLYLLKTYQPESNTENFLGKKPPTEKSSYTEKDLHALLAHFVYADSQFLGKRKVHTKTISHAKSTNRTKGMITREWLHPDMVGVYFPFGDMKESVIKLSGAINANSVSQLFSFELKREINGSNYRECFFQAVSNSSWAHAGYLVAAEIADNDELRRELERLANAFGIGIIHLNLQDFSASKIFIEANIKSQLDWETINRLCYVNTDFDAFITRLNIDFTAGQAHRSEYEEVIKNPSDYIRQKLKIKTVD